MNIEKSSSYFYALIIKAVLVFVLRLFVRMNWMRNFNWDSDKSKLAKDKSNLTSANLSCTWQFQLEEVTTCKLKKTLSIEKVSKWVGNSPILSGNPVIAATLSWCYRIYRSTGLGTAVECISGIIYWILLTCATFQNTFEYRNYQSIVRGKT